MMPAASNEVGFEGTKVTDILSHKRAAIGLRCREHLWVRRARERWVRGIVNRGNIVAAPAQL